MKRLLFACLAVAALFFTACSAPPAVNNAASLPAEPIESWQLAYAHNEEGQPLEGSKEILIEAVRTGKPVRLYVRGQRVEHSADALFLTIFGEEVFAQIDEIQMQAPSLDPPKVTFREPGRYWRTIYSTTGTVVALADGNEPRERQSGVRWYFQR